MRTSLALLLFFGVSCATPGPKVTGSGRGPVTTLNISGTASTSQAVDAQATETVIRGPECWILHDGAAVIRSTVRNQRVATVPIRNDNNVPCWFNYGRIFVGDGEPEVVDMGSASVTGLQCCIAQDWNRIGTSYTRKSLDGMLTVTIRGADGGVFDGTLDPGEIALVEFAWRPDDTFIPVVTKEGTSIPPEPMPYTVELVWRTANP